MADPAGRVGQRMAKGGQTGQRALLVDPQILPAGALLPQTLPDGSTQTKVQPPFEAGVKEIVFPRRDVDHLDRSPAGRGKGVCRRAARLGGGQQDHPANLAGCHMGQRGKCDPRPHGMGDYLQRATRQAVDLARDLRQRDAGLACPAVRAPQIASGVPAKRDAKAALAVKAQMPGPADHAAVARRRIKRQDRPMRAIGAQPRGIAPAMDHRHDRCARGQHGQLARQPVPVQRQPVGAGIGADRAGIVGHAGLCRSGLLPIMPQRGNGLVTRP